MLSIHDRDRRCGPLGEEAERILQLAFVEGRGSVLAQASQILRGLRQNHHWLACDCDGPSNPLMSPRRLPTGLVVLVRHGRVPHADDCPFHRLKSVADFSDAGAGEMAADKLDALTSSRHLPEDGMRLVQIMQLSGLDRIRPQDLQWHGAGVARRAVHRDVRDHYAQMDAADDLEICAGVSLGQVTCARPGGLGWLHRRIAEQNWPEGCSSMGYVLGSVLSVDGNVLHFGRDAGSGDSLELPEPAVCFGPSPALALVRLAWHEESLLPVSAFTYGVFSRGLLLPMESDDERTGARFLLEQIRYWHEQNLASITLHKPLTAPTGEARPAFVLEVSSRRLAVVFVPRSVDAAEHEVAMASIANLRSRYDTVLELPVGLPSGDTLFTLRKRVTAQVLAGLSGSASRNESLT
jgi:hypothetical protein